MRGRDRKVEGEMRCLILALAIAGAAGAANGCGQGLWSGAQDDVVPERAPTPSVPSGARQQGEDAVKHALGDPQRVTFRAVRIMEAASVKHGPFAQSIDGPVSVVCGQYASRDKTGPDPGYAWFFVALKEGEVLWSAADKASAGPGEAYYSCDHAALTPRSKAWKDAEFEDR
jgi:hypothetical protein